MEPLAPGRNGRTGTPIRPLAGEPLAWASAAALAGAAVGLGGTASLAAWIGGPPGQGGDPSALVRLAAPFGEMLVVLSLLGVLPILGGRPAGRPARVLGVPLVLLVFVHFLGDVALGMRWISLGSAPPTGGPPVLFVAFIVLGLCLPPVAALPFAASAFLGREVRLGAILLGLGVLAVPHLLVRQALLGETFGGLPPDVAAYVLFGGIGAGVGLPEAALCGLLAAVLFRAARERTRGEQFRAGEKANVLAARSLYEDALGRNDATALDKLVSENLRDAKTGARGRLGIERAFAALWRSYPDLGVVVKGQEAEGDLVKTRVLISGTDEGGVMWYPPTGRRVSFAAEFTDRFQDGLVVEHAGEADTEGLLEQLGHGGEDPPPT